MISDAAPLRAPIAEVRIAEAVDGAVVWFARHWSFCLTLILAPIVLLPILAPVLDARGFRLPSRGIYFVYSFACHQRADRSFHLDGHKMAFCERDLAIFAMAALGLLATSLAPRLRSLSPPTLAVGLVASLPMALDGFTQLVGLRESTWELRVVTGALFSAGWLWYSVPRLEAGFRNVVCVVQQRASASRLS